MLKGIPKILPPELLAVLCEMGHGDELVIADGNFPRMAYPQRVIRCDGHGVPEVLAAVLQLMPLDTYVEHPTAFMGVPPEDPVRPTIWQEYREIISRTEPQGAREEFLMKAELYDRARKAYAVVTTGETALYANIIVRKGVVTE